MQIPQFEMFPGFWGGIFFFFFFFLSSGFVIRVLCGGLNLKAEVEVGSLFKSGTLESLWKAIGTPPKQIITVLQSHNVRIF